MGAAAVGPTPFLGFDIQAGGAPASDLHFRVVDAPGPWLEVCWRLLRTEFGPEVLYDLGDYERLLTRTAGGGDDSFLMVAAHLLDGDRAPIVGVLSGSLLRVIDAAGPDGQGIWLFAIGHQITAAGLRQGQGGGVGRRLLEATEEAVGRLVATRRGRLYGLLAEAQPSAFPYIARVGFRWPRGVRYWQPPLDFDAAGLPVHAEVEEILMIRPAAGQPEAWIDRTFLARCVATLYRRWSLDMVRERLSPAAMAAAERYVMGGVFGRFRAQLPVADRAPRDRIHAPPRIPPEAAP
ncbi:MAG: hypothetical protein ABIO70_12475 [Pseudomonadota bacterium]